MRRAHRIETEPVEWLVPGIARGMGTVVSGRPGEGKSTWTIYVAALVSKFAPVILSNQEDHAAITLRPRLEAAGAKLDRVFIPEEPYLFPQDCDELERRLRMTGAQLLICDAAAQHLSVSSSSGQQIRKALTPLKGVLERTNVACIFVDHLIKRPSRTANPLEALAGAGSGMPAWARFVYVWGRNPHDQDERILAQVKGNITEEPMSYAFSLTGAAVFDIKGEQVEVGVVDLISDDSDVDASEVIAFNGGGKASDPSSGMKGAIAAEWLIGSLMFGKRKAKDLEDEAKQAGFSFRTLQRAGDKIVPPVIRHRIGAGPGSWVEWELDAKHPALKVAKAMGVAAAAGPKPTAAGKKKKP
jgi:hypothetical protein